MRIRPLHDHIVVQRIPEQERSKSGIIIPETAKVVRTARQNAASVASLMLTTECLVTQSPPPEGQGSDAGSHGRMDM